MERVMAELSGQFAADKLGPATDKAVLRERMRAEARSPTRDAIAVRRSHLRSRVQGTGRIQSQMQPARAEAHQALCRLTRSPALVAVGCPGAWGFCGPADNDCRPVLRCKL